MTSPAVVLPDEPSPVRLMNTIWADRFGVHDALTTPTNLRAWLASTPHCVDLIPGPRDVEQFQAVRDGPRRLAALLTRDTRPAAASATTEVEQAIADVNRAVARAPSLPQLAYDGTELYLMTMQPSKEVERALSLIASSAVELLTGDDRTSLRACDAPGCVLYFVKDHMPRVMLHRPAATGPAPPATTSATTGRRPTSRISPDERPEPGRGDLMRTSSGVDVERSPTAARERPPAGAVAPFLPLTYLLREPHRGHS